MANYIDNYNDAAVETATPKDNIFDLWRLISIILSIKWWIILSLIISLIISLVFLHYKTPLYKKDISVLLLNQGSGTDNLQILADIIGTQAGTKIENEVLVVKSTPLMEKVIEQLNVNIRYFYKEGINSTKEFYKNNPIEAIVIANNPGDEVVFETQFNIEHNKINIQSFEVNDTTVILDKSSYLFGEEIKIPKGKLMLVNQSGEELNQDIEYSISRITRNKAAQNYVKLINVSPVSKADVISIDLTDPMPQRAVDILTTLANVYNQDAKEMYNVGVRNTIGFLDIRLKDVKQDLDITENDYNTFRTFNELLDIQSQSQIALNQDVMYRERAKQILLQKNVLDLLRKYIDDLKGSHEVIPLNIGIEDPGLNTIVGQYNKLLMDRDRLSISAGGDGNPLVQQANKQLKSIRESISISIANLESSFNLQLKSIDEQLTDTQKNISNLPGKQQTLSQIARAQQIKEPLYILLQQKREEALITLAAVPDFSRIIEYPNTENIPSSPKKPLILLIAVFLGLAIPIGWVIILNLLRRVVVFETDITNRTDVPILGMIPDINTIHGIEKQDNNSYIVSESSKDILTESFRMIRSKFEFIDINRPEKGGAYVLQITSSVPGEGKSFISINLAMTLAYSGKKVLLIGADLRRPTLAKYMSLNVKSGFINYLLGQTDDIHSLMVEHGDAKNLKIIIAGRPVPNPTELLSTGRLEKAIEELRPEFDYIIFDSAPYIMVSDSMIISKSMDSVIYVSRANVTDLQAIDHLQSIYEKNYFKSIYIILNSVNLSSNSIYGSGYGYGRGYGYGYGYAYTYNNGYGYSYGNEEVKQEKKTLKSILKSPLRKR